MMDEKEAVKQELYHAICYFIKRQELVAQAMLDLGLDLEAVGEFGAAAWVPGTWEKDKETRASLTTFISELREKKPEWERLTGAMAHTFENSFPQHGPWQRNPEWTYFLHGKGCLLNSIETGEWINWNCPDVTVFDTYFLIDHLRWQIEAPILKDGLKQTQMWVATYEFHSIAELIGEMRDAGMVP
ncbi:MAG: hypothetical protein AAF485_31850 [Chloroflexota bacterium]